MVNLQDPKVGDTTLIKKMNKLQVLNNGKTFGGALGQFVKEYRGLKHIEHPGRTVGYKSYVTRFPEQEFAVVILSNSAELDADEIALKITDIYLEGHFQEKEKKAVAKVKPVIDESIVLDKETIASYLGEYEYQPGSVFSIIEENGQLMVKPTGGEATKLLPITRNEFYAEGAGANFVFEMGSGKKAELLKFINGEQTYEMKRVIPFDKVGVDLSEYTGEYYSEELSNVYDLKIEDGKLVAQPQNIRLQDLTLNPVKADMFMGNSPNFQEITFVRDANNSITGFKVSSERVKNLYFQKRK